MLSKGDADAGALLLVLTTRGVVQEVLERVSSVTRGFTWNMVNSGDLADSQSVARFIDGKKRFDPDLWIVELDIPDAEHFIADSLG